MSGKKFSVQGVCFTYPNLRKYILWALHLLEDMPELISNVQIDTTVKPGFDIYLVDDLPEVVPDGLVIHFKSKIFYLLNRADTHKNTAKSQSMHELELLAKSGFLSLVGLSTIAHGKTKALFHLPQQPTNTLMFYYVHSLMAVTKVMLHLGQKQVVENIAEDNLIYLCQGVFKMRKTNLWNAP